MELLPAKFEAWGHEDAEADIFERSESKQEAEVKLAAHTTKAEAVERRLPRLEKVESNSRMNELAENSASNQLEEELKKEQGRKPPIIIDKQDVGAEQAWHHHLREVEGFEVFSIEAEAEAMMDRMQSAEVGVQLKKVKQRLKEEKVSRYAMDRHKLSPLIADKLVPPDREGSEAEGLTSVGSLKVVEIAAKDRLDEVEKDWQGSDQLVIDKQDLVEVSASKKVEMRLKHALKAEAVQFKNMEVKLMEVKLMEEKLMEFLKQCLKLKACEEEEHEALQLLVDKQAAAAG